MPCTDRVWRPRGIICFPVILCQRKTDGRQIRNPSARDLPDLKTGSSVRGSVSSRERRTLVRIQARGLFPKGTLRE